MTISASPTTVAVGSVLAVSGTGCDPGEAVDIALDGTAIGSTTADDQGDYATDVTVPSSAVPGDADLTATCGLESSTLGIVLSASSALPATGSAALDRELAIATVLVVLGLALSGLGSRAGRRRTVS
jgi:hypothetical protein